MADKRLESLANKSTLTKQFTPTPFGHLLHHLEFDFYARHRIQRLDSFNESIKV